MKLLLGLALIAPMAMAQTAYTVPATTGYGGLFPSGVVTGVGQVGNVIDYTALTYAVASHTISWDFTGTAPTTCTVQLEGSLDGAHWYSLTGSQSCTTSNMVHVSQRPVTFARINVLTFAAGSGTLTMRYARGAQ